jgi:hypothetical protein
MKLYSLYVVPSILDGPATSIFCPSFLHNVTHLSVNKGEMGSACSRHERYVKERTISGKLEGKIPLQRARCRWDNNIIMYL